ncbi:MAG: hypothetical protein Q8N26_04170 [Myxococcales bacterium]|nr:hypothetical protein [Myxococcales bacterium]
MRVLVTSWLLLVACETPGRFEGQVAGHALDVRDALFFPLAGGPADSAVLLVLSDREGLCQSLASRQQSPNSSSLMLQLFRLDDAAALLPLAPGAYDGTAVVQRAGGFALGHFERTDGTCASLVPRASGEVVGGQLKVDQLTLGDAGRLTGSFELTFGPNAEQARGTFNARACAITALPASPVCL